MKIAFIISAYFHTMLLCVMPAGGVPQLETQLVRPIENGLQIAELTSAIGPGGRPHLLFTQFGTEDSSEPGQRVIYATVDDSRWVFETVSVGLWRSGDHSLTIDTAGHAHIALNDSNARDAIYGVRESGGWSFETLGANDSWTVPAIALDIEQRPVLAHFSYQSGGTAATPVLTTRESKGSWAKSPMLITSSNRNHMDEPDLIIDSFGVPHMAYTGLTAFVKPGFVAVASPDPDYSGMYTERRIRIGSWNDTFYSRVSLATDPMGDFRVASTSDYGVHGELIHYAIENGVATGDVTRYLNRVKRSSLSLAVDDLGRSWIFYSYDSSRSNNYVFEALILGRDGILLDKIDLSDLGSGRLQTMVSDSRGPVGIFYTLSHSGRGISYTIIPEPGAMTCFLIISMIIQLRGNSCHRRAVRQAVF